MSEKPVWMEDWGCEENEAHARVFLRGGGGIVFAADNPIRNAFSADRGRCGDRLGLAAAAPALVRALLLVEWQEPYARGASLCAANCGGAVFEGRDAVHHAGCPVDAALIFSGFPDQASRDAAREMIRKSK